MFDTNIFNRILDDKFDFNLLPKPTEIYATHIQHDEILNTPDKFKERRDRLLELFDYLIQECVPTEAFLLGYSRLGQARLGSGKSIETESGVWDLSNWGEFKWTKEDNLYQPILEQLKRLDNNKNRLTSHMRDSLIAETALKNNLTLVTADNKLASIVEKQFKDLVLLIT